MAKYYRVWVCVEEHDEEADTYEDVDFGPYGSLFETEDMDKAMEFAQSVHHTQD